MDRNINAQNLRVSIIESLSARRAWIEIEVENGFAGVLFRRSPQGERG